MPVGYDAIKRMRKSNYGVPYGQDVSQDSNFAANIRLANTIWISTVRLQNLPSN